MLRQALDPVMASLADTSPLGVNVANVNQLPGTSGELLPSMRTVADTMPAPDAVAECVQTLGACASMREAWISLPVATAANLFVMTDMMAPGY